MRLSISNIAWPVAEDAAVAGILAKHGVDAIDVAPSKYFPAFAQASRSEIAEVRARWAAKGVEIVGIQALLWGTDGLNLFAGAVVQDAMLEHLGHVCRIAEGLGARLLVFGSPRNRDRRGLADESAMEAATVFFRRLGDIAYGHSCVICLEPNPPVYGANFMTDLPSTAAVVRSVDHPAIRMQLDIGALTVNGEEPSKLLREHGDLIAHIHASEPHLVVLGEAGTDHAPAAAAVRAWCPGPVVSVEMREAAPTPLAAVDRALGFAAATYGDAA